MYNIPDLLDILDDSSISEMNLLDRGRVHLKSEFARDRVLPDHGHDFDLGFFDGGETGVVEFFAF
jgi:hypothetical protein